MSTLYNLKPRFQQMLRPLVKRLVAGGATANQVTVCTAAVSVLIGLTLCLFSDLRLLFLLLPLWLFARMALNAIDGLMAREHGQKTRLGGYLNELCDVVSDAALMLPFAFIAPFGILPVASVIFLAALSEYAGVMGPLVGASRRYDGPFGKSDRALATGALGLWMGLGFPVPALFFWLMPAMAALLIITTVNRVRNGLREQ